MNTSKTKDSSESENADKISDEEIIDTLLKVIESQSGIIRKMIRNKFQEKDEDGSR